MTKFTALKILESKIDGMIESDEWDSNEMAAFRLALKALVNTNTDNEVYTSLYSLMAALDGGSEPDMGTTVLSMNGYDWKIIDARKDDDGFRHVVLMVTRIIDYAPFARPTKKHPWGWNNYEHSQIRQELNTIWLDKLFGDEAELLHDYQGIGKLFLLSDEETGFEQTDNTFRYFRGADEGELYEKRAMWDMDDDECIWWLRSPGPSYANVARVVYPTGALNHSIAYNGHGAAPACEIIF